MYLWVCEWEPPTQTPIHFFFGSKYQSQVQQIRKTKQAQQKFPKQTETQRLELWLIGEDGDQDRGNPVEQSGDPSGQWRRRGLGVSLLGQEAQAPPLWLGFEPRLIDPQWPQKAIQSWLRRWVCLDLDLLLLSNGICVVLVVIRLIWIGCGLDFGLDGEIDFWIWVCLVLCLFNLVLFIFILKSLCFFVLVLRFARNFCGF